MSDCYIDTNAVLRFLLNDIPKQKKIVIDCLEKSEQEGSKIIVLPSVLAEIYYVFEKVYGWKREQFVPTLLDFLSTPVVDLAEDHDVLVSLLHDSLTYNLDFVDLLICLKAKHENRSVLSFDKKLNNYFKKIS